MNETIVLIQFIMCNGFKVTENYVYSIQTIV